LDKDGLLGIVYEVDAAHNEAYAVRADRIRELLDAARPQTGSTAQSTLAAAPVVSLVGTTPDPSHGPNDIYHSGDAAWNVLPAQGKISFLVTFPSSIHLKGVALTYASGQNAPVGAEVAVSAAPDSDDWTSLNYCPVMAKDGSIHCNVVTSTASKVRVTLKTSNDDAMNLSGFSIIQASSPQASAYDHSLGGLQPATSGGDEENIVFPNAESTNRTRDAAASPKVSSDADKGTTNHGVTIPDSAIATSFYLKATKLLEQKGKINTKTRVISVPHECLEAFRRYLELAPNGTHASEVRSILDLFNRHGQ
jgi:hypothetical protein